MLSGHLLNHENSADAEIKNSIDHLSDHLNWQPDFADRVVALAKKQGLLVLDGNLLHLSDAGRQRAVQEFLVKE